MTTKWRMPVYRTGGRRAMNISHIGLYIAHTNYDQCAADALRPGDWKHGNYKKALLTPRSARDSTAAWWIGIQYRQWLKWRFFIPLSYLAPPLPIFPLEFQGAVPRQETRVMGATELLCAEGCVILTSNVFDWSTRVTDGQTDGQTDRRTGDGI